MGIQPVFFAVTAILALNSSGVVDAIEAPYTALAGYGCLNHS